ncbi:TPA: conjugal transfer protein TraM [Enterobacter cloacae]|jgi:intracellular multiplication protein IcmL|uniref:Conjugal transfer protein TraM n=10 Tax=Gammaproteobacteria TaxID=1236 RepID=A0A427KHN5_ENTCL|nr:MULTISPECIES: DotI/IcmL family type IV secretion protein [Enterobacteriaceae]AJB79306.1 conjugal transfer protein TraM [Enterobacter hormaechei subsp. steigerwaltii]AJB84297.1 conjugal transfer protein TraM [Enterobacter hormaechei subsp. xiangfangensis]ASB76916.1 conjugal transfer protein TraM [Enterobacter cloacae complex sp.]EIX6203058.1 DotI/IcmL family type IV secretion protein [Cronobacter sakazakii]ELI8916282.1 DotI/IcmL family type IV secretion protein [Enterobacter kobei]EMB429590
MTKQTQSAPPAKGRAPSPAEDPLKNAVNMMKTAEKRQKMAPELMKSNLLLGSGLLISIILNAGLTWALIQQPRDYFATDSGRLVRLAPTSEPAWSQDDAIAFGSKALMRAFNLDFVHYREQVSSTASLFSEAGHASYIQALTNSNIYDALKRERMNLTGSVGAGVVIRRGRLSDGTWFWTMQYPVRLRLVGQTTSKPEQPFVFEITIQRVDPRQKPVGMEIRQMISRNAPRNL